MKLTELSEVVMEMEKGDHGIPRPDFARLSLVGVHFQHAVTYCVNGGQIIH